MSDPKLDRMKTLYAEGKSCAVVGEIVGVGAMTVHRRLKAAGVTLRDLGAGTRGKQWTAARREHHPAKPERDPSAPAGYEILTQRAIGNKRISSEGYVIVSIGRKKRQYEHILIAEKAMGCPLPEGYVVHHINCNRQDNRPENLLVCSIAYHLALHARMRRHPYWKQFH